MVTASFNRPYEVTRSQQRAGVTTRVICTVSIAAILTNAWRRQLVAQDTKS